MLQTIAVILIVVWAMGSIASYSMDGFIHVLPLVAMAMLLLRFVPRKRL